MNKFVLMTQGYLLYPENYTKEQLRQNAADAAAYAADAVNAASNADEAADAWTICTDHVEYWLNKYFERTGENRQDYIDAIHKENK